MANKQAEAGVINYNGEGRWSVAAVQARYQEYSRKLHVQTPQIPEPRELVQKDKRWIYPVMEAVIAGIERGDKACCEIGIEFIEEDSHFPFGKILKSNTARALRRTAALDHDQIARIRRRIISLFLAGHIPHEFREYAKLLRSVGIADCWSQLEKQQHLDNPHVKRYFEYFRAALGCDPK